MELHPDVEHLFLQAEFAFKSSVKERGRCDPFAMVQRSDGTTEKVTPRQGSGDKVIVELLTTLAPLVAADNKVKTSAICLPMDAGGQRGFVIDLEHREGVRILAAIHYEKKFFGWSFGPPRFTREPPQLFGLGAKAHVDIRNPDFSLRLSSDWRQLGGEDPRQFGFQSEEKSSCLIVSVVKANVPRDKLLEAARVYLDARQKAEVSADPDRKVVFGDRIADVRENGEVAHIAYAGYDDGGSIFRFLGWCTQTKMLSLWISTENRDNGYSKAVFDEVLKGFGFSIP